MPSSPFAAVAAPLQRSARVPSYPAKVARQTPLESARLRRDLGLARARRLTITVAIGATGLTGLIAFVAATTIPGRSAGTGEQSRNAPSGGDLTGISQPGLTAPAQLPQPVNGGVPITISGGS